MSNYRIYYDNKHNTHAKWRDNLRLLYLLIILDVFFLQNIEHRLIASEYKR